MNASNLRQVFECASPLALFTPQARQSAGGPAQSKTLTRFSTSFCIRS